MNTNLYSHTNRTQLMNTDYSSVITFFYTIKFLWQQKYNQNALWQYAEVNSIDWY